jgi:phage FluMu protein Com
MGINPTVLKIRCRSCGKVLQTSISNAGKMAKCPKCKKSFVVPSATVIGNRRQERAVVEENRLSPVIPEKLTRKDGRPFCRVFYTEADPVLFVLSRQDSVPMLDISERGLGVMIKADQITPDIVQGSILLFEVDFPILAKPIFARVEVRWIERPENQQLCHLGVEFHQPGKELQAVVHKLIEYVLSRPEHWKLD